MKILQRPLSRLKLFRINLYNYSVCTMVPSIANTLIVIFSLWNLKFETASFVKPFPRSFVKDSAAVMTAADIKSDEINARTIFSKADTPNL